MSDKQLVLALFDDEAAADGAAQSMKDSGAASGDAMGILVLDEKGELKVDKVGARSTAAGAGVGGVLLLLGPAALGVGVVGGALAGTLHHKGLGLDETDKARITSELQDGKAAVGVLVPAQSRAEVSERLSQLGGTPESHDVTDEGLQAVAAADTAT